MAGTGTGPGAGRGPCASAPLWARPELRTAAGDTLRPGGFALTDRAAEHIGAAPGWRVLDVGCGLGATVSRLRSRFGVAAWGAESSPAQLARTAALPGLLLADAATLPFPGNSLDALFCECVLSLLPDQDAALGEFHRVLRPGGFLVLSDLCAPRPDSNAETGAEASCSALARPVEETRDMLEARGFSLALLEDHSRHLRDLGARLILAGMDTGGEAGPGEHPACGPGHGLGYYLMIGQKRKAAHV